MGEAKAFLLLWSPPFQHLWLQPPGACNATWVRFGTANHGFLFFFWNTLNSCKGQFSAADHTGLGPWIQISVVSRALGLSSAPQNLSAWKHLHSFQIKIGVIDSQCLPSICTGNLTFGSLPSLGASLLMAGAGASTCCQCPPYFTESSLARYQSDQRRWEIPKGPGLRLLTGFNLAAFKENPVSLLGSPVVAEDDRPCEKKGDRWIGELIDTSQGGWCDQNHNPMGVGKLKSCKWNLFYSLFYSFLKGRWEIYIAQLQYWFSGLLKKSSRRTT